MATPEFELLEPGSFIWYYGGVAGGRYIRVYSIENGRVQYRHKHLGGWKKATMNETALALYRVVKEEDVNGEDR